MHPRTISLLIAGASIWLASPAGAESVSGQIHSAVTRSVAVMEKSIAEYPKHNGCFSCHHQGVPSLAISLARTHGFAMNDNTLTSIGAHTLADLRTDLESYRQGKGQPGGVTRAGYALFALQSSGAKRTDVTAAVTEYLLVHDAERSYWRGESHRPPAEQSDFTNTFLSIRALKAFGVPADRQRIANRLQHARAWLEAAEPKDTEDRVFRLWAMVETGSEHTVVAKATDELMAQQRVDGGWSQLPDTASDAYATGTVLTMLQMTGMLPPESDSCRHGVAFLLRTQNGDGSWHVISRSKPVQPYFESGFPYGRDQFISMAATGWAASALILADSGSRTN